MATTDEWTRQAKCIGRNDLTDSLFFSPNADQVESAKDFCNGKWGGGICPVRDECVFYAMQHNISIGVWGGMSGRQRRRFKFSRRVQQESDDDC
jgi:WhiB family redox-sensing transcriptional regulator